MFEINQISVFLSNKAGRIADICEILGSSNIDLVALSVADTESYGVLRIITDNNEKAASVLRANGFIISSTDVLAVEIPNEPGALAEVLKSFDNEGISIEYIYAFVGASGSSARIIIRVNDNEKGIAALRKTGAGIITREEIESK
ncbi:MAG: hypothetical protein ILO53_07685 [Clostridia bacterium]|nr:hypothetical protein [Clostridia bacterium]